MPYGMLLGAGFSKWAVNLPLASELFDFRLDVWHREASRLKTVNTLKTEWDKSHVGQQVEQFVAEAMTYPEKEREAVIWYITRRLVDPFLYKGTLGSNYRHVLGIDDPNLRDISGVQHAARFLADFSMLGLKTVITTNYDLLVEYALGSRKFHYGTPGTVLRVYRTRRTYRSMQEEIVLRGHMPVLKLHGSISWEDGWMYGDGRCGLKGSALVIPPVPEKVIPEFLRLQWTMAHDTLEETSALVVFGFSFNPYDTAVLELLKSAGRNLRHVLLVDVAPQISRAQSLWPQAKIMSCQPPPSGNDVIRSWQPLQ